METVYLFANLKPFSIREYIFGLGEVLFKLQGFFKWQGMILARHCTADSDVFQIIIGIHG